MASRVSCRKAAANALSEANDTRVERAFPISLCHLVATPRRRWHLRLVAWVYLLLCADNSLYVGATTDLVGRVDDHQAGKGGAFTRRRRPVVLVHSEEFGDIQAAVARERQIKGWTRQKKQALIRDDFETLTKLARRTPQKS